MKKITILLLSLSAAFYGRGQNLVAHYDFTGVTGVSGSVIPDVAGTHNGIMMGTGIPTGTSLHLSSGNFVQIPGNPGLDFTRWTIKINLTFNNFNPGFCQVNEVIKHGVPGSNDFYGIQTDDNNFDAVVLGFTSTSAACSSSSQQQPFGLAAVSGPFWASYPGAPTIAVGIPYCITATYGTDDTMRVYINGVQWYAKYWAYQYGASGSPDVIIGSNTGFFDGTIDDVELYDYAVNPSQFSNGGCTILPPPIASNCSDSCYWKVTGNTILNGNNIFGTMSPHDIDIRTSGNSIAIFTKDGNFDYGAANFLDPATSISSSLGLQNRTTSSANTAIVGMTDTMDNSSNSAVTGKDNGVYGSTAVASFGGHAPFKGNSIKSTKSSISVGINNIMDGPECSMANGTGNKIYGGGREFAFGEGNKLDHSDMVLANGGGNQIITSGTSMATGSSNTLTTTNGTFAAGSANNITTSQNSMANGLINVVTNQAASFAAGNSNSITNTAGSTGNANMALGRKLTITGSATTMAAGDTNTVNTSSSSMVSGANNNIQSSISVAALGRGNIITGSSHSITNGSANWIVDGKGNLASGQVNRIFNTGGTTNYSNSSLGQDNLIDNSWASGIIGLGNNIISASGSFTAGANNTVTGNYNQVLGRLNNANGNDVHIYGQGVSNNLPNSIVMGFNSNRTMVTTDRGVAIQWNPTSPGTTPASYNLEVDAQVLPGQIVASNISFHNLPTTTNSYPTVVTNPATGELFRGASAPPPTFNANQGLILNGTTFELGYACSTGVVNPFTVNRGIALANNNLTFNSGDIGKLYMGNQVCPNLVTRLEISSAGIPGRVNSNVPVGAPSYSGLRFTDLTSQFSPLPNPGNGVLSLDQDGDVIWVADQTSGANADNGCSISGSGSVQLGRDCGTSGAGFLTSDREIPMADNKVIFSDGATATPFSNRIGIGTTCNVAPIAKLEVLRNQEAGAGYDIANKAFAARNLDLSPVEATGVYGEANNLQNTSNVGGDFLGKDGHNSTFGVRALAQSQGLNAYGGWFEACGASVQNWGVYGSVCNPRKGIDYAGYFNGDVTATGIVTWSDENIKKNIKPIDNALSIISRLNPRQYEFDNSKYPSLNVSSNSVNYGVIAQELEQVLPTLVSKVGVPKANGQKGASDEHIKGVNYIELIPILIQAVKDQQSQIEAGKAEVTNLKSENETLKAQLAKFDEKFAMLEASITNICENGCPGLTKTETGVKTETKESKDQLFQSIPNPTDNKAIINYFLARNYENASIVISNMEGKTIRNIMLDPKSGSGSITIELGEYAAQTYVYSLYVNKQIVDSKKMTVIK